MARPSIREPESADRLVESVPNVSEGRRLDVVERLAEAIASVPEVHLLDRTSDASHNRSVFTIAGPAGPVRDALDRLVGPALDEIDMATPPGEHPRIGAVDVIPFVPLGDTTMDEAVGIARDFGRRIADRCRRGGQDKGLHQVVQQQRSAVEPQFLLAMPCAGAEPAA